MSEILAPDTLEKLAGFTAIQRILLATAGTLQSTLSAYFGAPVDLELLNQTSRRTSEEASVTTRSVDLRCNRKTVCHADSEVSIQSEDIQQMVAAGEVGLGQILEQKGIRPAFLLLDVGQTKWEFSRTYSLTAPGVDYRIKERFLKVLYEK